MENLLGLFRCGRYNEVALLLRWPLSEVSLYLISMSYQNCHYWNQEFT